MTVLDQPLAVLAVVALGLAAFWRLTRRAGSAEALGPDGADRMDERSLWWSFAQRRTDAARKQANTQDTEETRRLRW